MQRNSRLKLLMQRGSLLLKEKGLLCRGEFVGGAASLTVRIQRQLLEDEASAEGMTGTVVEKKQPVAEQKTGVCRQLMKTKMLLMLCRDEVTMVFLVQSCSSVMIQ
ncbi:hypothetical protein D5086_013124 [Populus alba]|uniref:Uncharacterized protein n=1 Tax=Populus alba TaxID=43335 RepID=A0ACC4C5B8_POPAL